MLVLQARPHNDDEHGDRNEGKHCGDRNCEASMNNDAKIHKAVTDDRVGDKRN